MVLKEIRGWIRPKYLGKVKAFKGGVEVKYVNLPGGERGSSALKITYPGLPENELNNEINSEEYLSWLPSVCGGYCGLAEACLRMNRGGEALLFYDKIPIDYIHRHEVSKYLKDRHTPCSRDGVRKRK